MIFNQEILKMKEEYVQDTARVRGMIINATERMEKEKRKVDKHTKEGSVAKYLDSRRHMFN